MRTTRNQMLAFGLGLGCFFLAMCASAGEPVVVYVGSAAVMSDAYETGVRLVDGVAVPASIAMTNAPFYLGFLNGDLHKGSLLKLDMSVNAGVLKIDELVTDAPLATAHRNRADALSRLWTVSPISGNASQEPTVAEDTVPVEGSFSLEINDVPVGLEPIKLKSYLNKVKCTLILVRTVDDPFWKYDLELEASPTLAFWKPSKRTSLNEVPTKIFRTGEQTFLKPWRKGARFVIPVEIYYIKQSDYVMTLRVKTKTETYERRFRVHIDL